MMGASVEICRYAAHLCSLMAPARGCAPRANTPPPVQTPKVKHQDEVGDASPLPTEALAKEPWVLRSSVQDTGSRPAYAESSECLQGPVAAKNMAMIPTSRDGDVALVAAISLGQQRHRPNWQVLQW